VVCTEEMATLCARTPARTSQCHARGRFARISAVREVIMRIRELIMRIRELMRIRVLIMQIRVLMMGSAALVVPTRVLL
jgi:hypothetical protein